MNPREAISAQSAEQRKNTFKGNNAAVYRRRLPMELLLFLICSLCALQFLDAERILKEFVTCVFWIRGGVERILKKKPTFRGQFTSKVRKLVEYYCN